jgi:hypothetical protein
MFVTSQLTKVLDIRQNYLCDFHLFPLQSLPHMFRSEILLLPESIKQPSVRTESVNKVNFMLTSRFWLGYAH